MTLMFIYLFAEHLGGSLLIYPLVWVLMRKKNGETLYVSNLWLLAGWPLTAFGAAIVRFLAFFVIGVEEARNPEGLTQIFLTLIVPITMAVLVGLFLRTKAKNKISDKAKEEVE